MRRQCPDCKTVTGGHAGYCGACGYRFLGIQDPVRAMAFKPKTEHVAAAMMGLAVAVLQYILLR